MPAPQLADSISFNSLAKLVDSDEWSFEQKLDGDRLMVAAVDGATIGFNRKGEGIPVPKELSPWVKELESTTGSWLFDGEFIDKTFWVFDLPITPVDGWDNAPYDIRREVLAGVVNDSFNSTGAVLFVLPVHKDPVNKRALMRTCVDIKAEGIVAKKLYSVDKNGERYGHPYAYGKRVPWMLKAKLWASADVIVSKVSPNGKQSVEIEVFYHGKRLNVGSCKVTERVLATIQVDDVIECKYLYATEAHKLYQPSLLKVRTDKAPEECTLHQLKPVNKRIILP